MKIEDIAQVAHEINRAYCQAINDAYQPSWAEAPEWQVNSILDGVEFHLNNPDAGPEASHNNWLKQKKEDDWCYGEVKSEVDKTHPCIMPFEDLPIEQQAKDYLFRQVVHSLSGYFMEASGVKERQK